MAFLKIEKFKIDFLRFLESLKYIPTVSRFTTRLKLWTCKLRNQNAWNTFRKKCSSKNRPLPSSVKIRLTVKIRSTPFWSGPLLKYFFPTALLNQRTSIMQYFLNFHPIRPFSFSFIPLPFYPYRHRDFDTFHR